jgi:peptide deformylase
MADAGQIKNVELDAEREARRRLALSRLRHYPDPVLRMRAREVDRFDEALARQAEGMIAIMHDASGVGLAANQVGSLQRMFVIELGEEEQALAIVNPRVTPIGDERETDEEGCLSLQGVLVPVERAISVRLEAQGLDGRELTLELEGLVARAVQHEIDHLDGVLTFDRTTLEARREALALLRPRVVLTSNR